MDLFLQREGRLKFLILKGGFGSMFSGIIYHLITVQGIVSDMQCRYGTEGDPVQTITESIFNSNFNCYYQKVN